MKQQPELADIFKAYGGIGRGGIFCAYRWLVFPHKKISEVIPQEGLIYDVGCGYGIFSIYLAFESKKRKIVGVDYSSIRLKSAVRARKNLGLNNLTFQKEDFFNIKWQPCEAIVINDVLHHIPGSFVQEKLLKRVMPVIKPGGKLIIVDVDRYPKWKYYLGLAVDLIFYPGAHIAYPKKNVLCKFLINNGFDVKVFPMHYGRPYASIIYVATKNYED